MHNGDPLPSFSIIVPTHNRPLVLRRCLESLVDLRYPVESWEVIVINDGSTKRYDEVIAEFEERLRLYYVKIEQSGPAAARNHGAQIAGGDTLIFIDDDCTAAPDLLEQYAAGFRDTRLDALGGPSLRPLVDHSGAVAWYHLTHFLYDYWRDSAGNSLILISNNFACRKDVFLALGGFDATFPKAASEDREFSLRLLANGYSQAFYAPATVQHHHHHLSFGRYLRLQFRYGMGSVNFHRKSKGAKRKVMPRFGRWRWLTYVVGLVRYTSSRRIPYLVAILLVAGHIAHFFGRVYQTFTDIRGRS